MKRLFAALLATTIMFAPAGAEVFQDHATTVEAKSYKSGKKSFNTNNSGINNNNSNFQNKKEDTAATNKSAANQKQKGAFSSGGLMKGLMLGGLAGLLFGGLLANMGVLGSLLGLMVNVLAVVALIMVIRKIVVFFMDKKKEDPNPWRS